MKEVSLPKEITAQSRYEALTTDREPYLRRGRQCAALTIPAILPEQGHSSSVDLPTPYQSVGARGVRTLASKLLLSLFPTIPFFNYKVEDQTLEEVGTQRGEIEKALARRERAVVAEVDTSLFRPIAFQTFLHLVVTGNICVYVPPNPKERARAYRIDQYVCRRDPTGALLELVIHEKVDLASLPQEYRVQILKLDEYKNRTPNDMSPAEVNMYTHVYLDEQTSRWVVYQEAGRLRLPGGGTYIPEEMPFMVLRLSTQPGEHYGRSYVEEYLGDLDSLEALTEVLVEGSAAAARIVYLVDPGGTTSMKVVANAKNGAVVSGRADDVTVMQAQKQQDLQVARAQAEEIGKRLASAFLMHGSVQRAGERVTAEEIRFMASELDDALGGVYTLLAVELQLPSVRLFEKRMEKRLKVPPLPKDMVKPVIITGLQAIGRGHDQRNLQLFTQEIVQVLGPEIVMQYMNPGEYIKRSAASYSIDTNGLVPSDEEMAQRQQQAQMMQMLQQFGPEILKQAGGMGNTALKATMESTPEDVEKAAQASGAQ